MQKIQMSIDIKLIFLYFSVKKHLFKRLLSQIKIILNMNDIYLKTKYISSINLNNGLGF